MMAAEPNAIVEHDDFDNDYEPHEFEEAMANCCGWFDKNVFVCGAVGSEDCDACPFYDDLGLTADQIAARDEGHE